MLNLLSALGTIGGLGTGLGTGQGAPPSLPPDLASPETMSGGKTPEPATILASPLASRIGGEVLSKQEQAQLAKIAEMVRQGLKILAAKLVTTNPKNAAQLEKWAATLIQLFPATPQPTDRDIPSMTKGMPSMGMGGMLQPPPPAGPPTGIMPAAVGKGGMPNLGGGLGPSPLM